MIEQLIWDQYKYSVGHPLLDQQHEILFGMINELIELSTTDYRKADLLKILIKMSSYASYHFRAEEAIAASVNSPDIESQSISHEAYSEKVNHMAANCTGDELDQVLGFLANWWTTHILEEDMKLKPLFQSGLA